MMSQKNTGKKALVDGLGNLLRLHMKFLEAACYDGLATCPLCTRSLIQSQLR